MPTINEVIERVDRVKVNPYEDQDKARWLMKLDGELYEAVFRSPLARPAAPLEGLCPGCGAEGVAWSREGGNTCSACGWTDAPTPPRLWPEEGDKPLLVPAPYDELYDLYLFAMIDYHDREYGGYNNDMERFNAALGAFRRHWRREHMPRPAGGWKGRL